MNVTTAIQNASRAIGSMISGSTSEPEILDTLKQEHEEVGEMLKKLVASENGPARKNLVAKIKAALIPHLQAEQAVLYDALIAIGDKKIRQDSQEGTIEHELAATTLAKLEAISNPLSSEFGAAAKVLKELIEHHVKEEERNVWADAKEKFSAEQRVAMNRKYLAAKKLIGAPAKTPAAAPKTVSAPKKAAAPKGTVPKSTVPKSTVPKSTVIAAKPEAKAAVAPGKPLVAAPPKKETAAAPKQANVKAKPSPAAKPRSRPAAPSAV